MRRPRKASGLLAIEQAHGQEAQQRLAAAIEEHAAELARAQADAQARIEQAEAQAREAIGQAHAEAAGQIRAAEADRDAARDQAAREQATAQAASQRAAAAEARADQARADASQAREKPPGNSARSGPTPNANATNCAPRSMPGRARWPRPATICGPASNAPKETSTRHAPNSPA